MIAAVGCAASEAPRAAPMVVPNMAEAGAAAAPVMLDPVAECIASHPPSDPFDVGDLPAQRAGTMAPPRPPPLMIIADACRQDGGSECEPEKLMSKQAAECIATLHGFPEDARPWSTSLSYFNAPKRVVWSMMFTVIDSLGAVGRRILIDAIDGRLLDESAFRSTP